MLFPVKCNLNENVRDKNTKMRNGCGGNVKKQIGK